jgi:hypothetical protein
MLLWWRTTAHPTRGSWKRYDTHARYIHAHKGLGKLLQHWVHNASCHARRPAAVTECCLWVCRAAGRAGGGGAGTVREPGAATAQFLLRSSPQLQETGRQQMQHRMLHLRCLQQTGLCGARTLRMLFMIVFPLLSFVHAAGLTSPLRPASSGLAAVISLVLTWLAVCCVL